MFFFHYYTQTGYSQSLQSLSENNEVMTHIMGQPGYCDTIKECLLEEVAATRMGQFCPWQ